MALLAILCLCFVYVIGVKRTVYLKLSAYVYINVLDSPDRTQSYTCRGLALTLVVRPVGKHRFYMVLAIMSHLMPNSCI